LGAEEPNRLPWPEVDRVIGFGTHLSHSRAFMLPAGQGRERRTAIRVDFVGLTFLLSAAGVGCPGSFVSPASSDAGEGANDGPARDGGAGDDARDATSEESVSEAGYDASVTADVASDAGAKPCTPRSDAGGNYDWAAWPVPNIPADVEAGAGEPASYTDDGDGTVTDNVTHLMWERSTTGYGTFVQVQSYCANLSLAGHCDWRLPSWVELYSITDHRSSPSVNGTYFPGTPATSFWVSTPANGQAGSGWRIDFADGHASYASLTDAQYVRCVR
jgi:hypothetical protein